MDSQTEEAKTNQLPEKGSGPWRWLKAGGGRVRLLKVSILINVAFAVFALAGFAGAAVINESYTNPQFCAICHNMKSYVDSYLTGSTMDNVHKQANVGCKDCHSNYSIPAEITSAVKYVVGDYDPAMPRLRFDQSMCTKCHISLTYHANRTDFLVRNPHLSHWPDLKCGTCHISHGEEVDYCSKCHDNGGQRMTGGEIVPRAQNPWMDPARERPSVTGS